MGDKCGRLVIISVNHLCYQNGSRFLQKGCIGCIGMDVVLDICYNEKCDPGRQSQSQGSIFRN